MALLEHFLALPTFFGGFLALLEHFLALPCSFLGLAFFGGLGTFAGAFLAEHTRKDLPAPSSVPDASVPAGEEAPSRSINTTLKAAGGATIGRLLGTLGKAAVAAVVWTVLTLTAFVV